MKRLKNIENENEKQLKAIEDQKEFQNRIISTNKIKPLLLKSIFSQVVKDGRTENNEAKKKKKKKIVKTLEDMEGSKIVYSKLV